MTKEDAIVLADNIIRCGDKQIGAGMILGALAVEKQTIINMMPPYPQAVGSAVVHDPKRFVKFSNL